MCSRYLVVLQDPPPSDRSTSRWERGRAPLRVSPATLRKPEHPVRHQKGTSQSGGSPNPSRIPDVGKSRSSSSDWPVSLQRTLQLNPEAGDPKEAAPRREDLHRCCCHHLYRHCETPPDAATEEAGEGAPACPLPPSPPPGPRRFVENHSHVTVWHSP